MMKFIWLLSLCALLSACGSDEADPILGRFEVERTFVRSVINDPETCGESRYEPGEVLWDVWVIEDSGDDYVLSSENAEFGLFVNLARSPDGHTFTGGGSFEMFECMWNITWVAELKKNGEEFTGTETDTLIMACAPGSCAEVWGLIGGPLE